MKIKDQKIEIQLIVGFAIMLMFVIVLGVVSYSQSSEMHENADVIYNHPLKVGRAIGLLDADILSMRLGNRDLMLAKDEAERQVALQLMSLSAADAEKQFVIIKERYLGPQSDVDEAYKAYVCWITSREGNTERALLGKFEEVKESVRPTGTVGKLRDKMLAKIQILNDYADNKGEDLYASSDELKNSLRIQLILLVLSIVVIMLIISFLIVTHVRQPIQELTDAAKRFHEGDMSVRSTLDTKNEFGLLSDSFNVLVESIQRHTDLNKKVSILADSMLIEEEANKFFQLTLPALAEQTNSQIAAAYLLSDDKKHFEHFESVGMTNTNKQILNASGFEGEFGLAIASGKIQNIKNIPIDTRFIFQTVSGKFIPREIITIPIIVSKEVVAIISLASIRKYSDQSNELISNIYDTLNARIEGILTYRKMKKFSEKLEFQNSELEAKKTELAMQSSVLIEQNTELEMQKNQLRNANRLKTNFLSNMSHELRTPLNSVIALSGVLNRRLLKKISEEEYSYLEVIERNGKHLLSLINDILDISRIESGRIETEITTFNANDLITEIISMIKPQADQKNLDLLQVSADSEIIISSDAHKCRHIFQNLIANAVKFTEKGKVEINAEKIDGNIIVTITDTGIGISEKHLPHIFDEFRQADGSTSRKFGGTGLGLAIARKYANLLGGNVTVESILNEGSVFTLILPLSYDIENQIVEQEIATTFNNVVKPISPNYHSGKTILLVEDSDPAIIQIKDFMEDSGYKILVAHDGGEALKIIDQTIPDAMILDLMMPGIDGFQVLTSLRNDEKTAQIPVLILTAKHITKDDIMELKRNNVHELIQKGDVNKVELLKTLAALLFPEIVEVLNPQRELQIIEGKPLVLVVEDNPDNMLTVKAILVNNFTVIGAVDGKEGVKMAELYKPNLILMDVELPGMDGIEAFKMIRNNPKLIYIPVIALTASAMTSERETILAHGFDAYLAKPIEQKEFFNTINEILYGK